MERIFNIIPGPQQDTCCILIYGPIMEGESAGAQDIVTQLLTAERTYRKIDVHINSYGGEVATGIAIFNALRQSTAEVTIYIDCIAASTASFISACGRTVKMSRYAQLMIHRPTGGTYGDAENLKGYIAQLEQVETMLCQIYAERTGRSVEEIRATYMDGAEHWLTADEALAQGFIDEIYDDVHMVQADDNCSRSELCDRYTMNYQNYLDTINVSHKTQKQMINKFKERAAFADCADEVAIMNRVAEIEEKASKYDAVVAERDTLQKQVEEYKAQQRQAQDAAYDAEVDVARQEERIGADEVESFKRLMRRDVESTRALLAARKPKRKVMDTLHDDDDASHDPWRERFDEIRKQIQ